MTRDGGWMNGREVWRGRYDEFWGNGGVNYIIITINIMAIDARRQAPCPFHIAQPEYGARMYSPRSSADSDNPYGKPTSHKIPSYMMVGG
jgi:hypothetical protein